MASITQQIPFYIHGISEQPDELKKPGQLRDAKNCLPDVATGLSKRPGARLVNTLGFNEDGTGSGSVKAGTWFSIYRDENEQYIGHINKSGAVEIWDCLSGMPCTIYYSTLPLPTHYPNKPENPDDLGRPANDTCDVVGFTETQNNVKSLKLKKEKKQIQIDGTQSGIDFLNAAGGNQGRSVVDYDDKGGGVYVIKQGYIKGCLYNGKGGTSVRPENWPSPYDWDTCTLINGEIDKPENGFMGEIIDEGMNQALTERQYSAANRAELGFFNATLYDWKVKPRTTEETGQTLAELEAQMAAQLAELAVIQADLDAAYAAYATQAHDCGVYDEPDSPSGYNLRSISEENLLAYLKHQNTQDLQVLTVNDYTFVTNRDVQCSMSNSEANMRPYEGFIDVKQVAYGKQYAINIWHPDNSTQVTTSHASALTVTDDAWSRSQNGCTDIGTEEFTVNKDDKTNLRFRLTTTGQSILKNPNDPEEGYKCNYNTTCTLLFGGENWVYGDEVVVTMKEKDYRVVVSKAYETTAMLGSQIRPEPTNTDGTTVLKVEEILANLAAAIEENNALYNCEIIGNGIYVTSGFPFLIETPEAQLMNILTDRVNNVSKLPTQCKDGYQVRIDNTSGDEDDYYVEFETKYNGVSGEGTWQEIAHPGVAQTLNWASMPHQIVRQSDGSFLVSPVEWKGREVGDNLTNPVPSFVGKTINRMLFYRNRLTFLSDENVIMSRPGDFFNLFATTALKMTADDPIDFNVASTYPAILQDGIEVNAGLLLFSANQQFLVTTDNDLLTAETVKVNSLSSYRFNTFTKPISMGPTVGFVNDAGSRTRFFEMTNIKREGEVEVIEQSKTVSKSIPSGVDLIAESKENSIVFLGKAGQREVWVYKYFQDGAKRIQSAWVKWELTGNLVYHAVLGDAYFVVVENQFENKDTTYLNVLTLQRLDLKDSLWSAIVADGEGYEYTVHMDNYLVVWPTELQYYEHLDQTYFRLPIGYFSDKQLAAYTLKYGKYQGRAIYPKVEVDNQGTWCVLDGNWIDTRLMLGYEFEMSAVFPTMYVQKKTQTGMISDTRGNLMVQRCNLDLGPSGVYETTLKRVGREDYTMLYETRDEDAYKAGEVVFVPDLIQTVPIYERNINVTLELKSRHPSPATLYSMNWEGNYTPDYYSSV